MRKIDSDTPPEDGAEYIGYRLDRGRVRWWRSTDPGDTFEMLSEREFLLRRGAARATGVRVVDLDLYGED